MPLALIADDEPNLIRHLQSLLTKAWPELEFTPAARNGIEAADRIKALAPDIAFLDIQMPGLTGLEVAQEIEGDTRVAFVTAYDEYAVQAFEHEALDYILKPVTAERLQLTVQRLQRALAAPPADDARLADALRRLMQPATSGEHLRWIRASQGDLTHQVAVQDVLFFRADEKYTCVQTATAEHLVRTPIFELSQQLDPALFVQVHRSTIVNLDHLEGTRRDESSRLFLRLKGHATELPVSRAYVHLFKAM